MTLNQAIEYARAKAKPGTPLEAALREVEWISSDTHEYCPWCHGVYPGQKWRVFQVEGHAPDCARQTALEGVEK